MEPGTLLHHYRILGPLGAGGMGEVYRARDTKLDRDAAIKVLPRELAASAERIARFAREAKALAALNHPNIVVIYTIDECDGTHFLAMELVEGETLDRRIPAQGMAIDELLAVAVPLADAVAAAHQRGVTHRDIKPGNVMINTERRVKVLDFGLAKLAADDSGEDTRAATVALTGEGKILGTPAYMSPEQAEGRALDHRSDVFSLGALLYEMASGRRPFQGDSAAAMIASIIRDEPASLSRLRPGLPADLVSVVGRTLEKDPARRYQSAAEVCDELRALRQRVSRSTAARDHDESRFAPQTPRAGIHSIAVLPLANLSGDPSQEFFSDGMTEALITDLAKLSGLRVISRTSAMRFKHSDKSLPEIAAELDVDAVIEGSVLRAQQRVRISAQLIDVRGDAHLWAESYDRDVTDILALQSEVARAIAGEIRAKLDGRALRRLPDIDERQDRIDPRAHEEYLRGKHRLYSITADGAREALRHFNAAIEIDPTYGPAYAGVADVYQFLGSWMKTMPASEAMAKGKAAARKSLELGPESSQAHAALAYAAIFFDWEWETAEHELARAREINASDSSVHVLGSFFHSIHLRYDEALASAERGYRVDPLSPWVNATRISPRYLNHRFDEAIEMGRRVIAEYPGFPTAHFLLGLSYAANGEFAEAVEQMKLAVEVGKEYLGWLGYVYGKGGDEDAARATLAELEDMYRQGLTSADDLARVHIGLGELDAAFELLDQALDERAVYVVYLQVEHCYEPLRGDPRYRALLERLHLAD